MKSEEKDMSTLDHPYERKGGVGGGKDCGASGGASHKPCPSEA